MGSSTWTIIGAGVGFAVGGPTGAMAGSSIGGGIDRMGVANSNANASLAYGQWNMQHRQQIANYNAQLVQQSAAYNAKMTETIAGINATTTIMGAQISAMTSAAVASYNAQVSLLTSEYNARLLEQEARLVYDKAELDIDQYERQAAQAKGTATVFYGASGVLIDEPRDSPANALMEMDIERDLEIAIMRYNADLQAGKILTAAAQGRFEGNVAAQQIMFEGLSTASMTMFSGALSGISQIAGGALEARSIRYQGDLQSHNIVTQGIMDSRAIWADATWQASQLRQGGQQAFMNGLFQAGTVLFASAGQTKKPVSPTSGAGGGPRAYTPKIRSPAYGPLIQTPGYNATGSIDLLNYG